MRSRRVYWSGAAIVVVVLICVVKCRNTAPTPSRPEPPPRVPVGRTVLPTASAAPGPETPEVVIDSIDVEKPELCAGDENLITVHAHAVRPEDAPELQIQIDGIRGTSVALRPTRYTDVDGSPPRVIAFVHPDKPVEMVIPEFRIKTCSPDRIVEVRHRLLPNASDSFEFWAQVIEVSGGPPLHARRYRWKFGDGTSSVSTTPIVEKSFHERAQDTLLSELLVECTVEGDDGVEVSGRDNISLLNSAYEALHRKQVVILQFDKPRFPERDAHGVVQFDVRIWHHDPAPVTITDVHVVRVERESGAEGGPPQQAREIPVEELLHTTRIPPTGITITARMDTNADPNASYYLYRLEGHTDQGFRVAGEFSVMRPTDHPPRENSIPVSDPVLMGKILQAQELLGKQYVTDEDIWRLEREGKIDGNVDPERLPAKIPEQPVGPKGSGSR
jgi:hypothetical protein